MFLLLRTPDQVEDPRDPFQIIVYAHDTAHEDQTGYAVYTIGNGLSLVQFQNLVGNLMSIQILAEITGPSRWLKPEYENLRHFL